MRKFLAREWLWLILAVVLSAATTVAWLEVAGRDAMRRSPAR